MENKTVGRPVIRSHLHSTSDCNRKWSAESQHRWPITRQYTNRFTTDQRQHNNLNIMLIGI